VINPYQEGQLVVFTGRHPLSGMTGTILTAEYDLMTDETVYRIRVDQLNHVFTIFEEWEMHPVHNLKKASERDR